MSVRDLWTRLFRAAERGDPRLATAVSAPVTILVAALFAFADWAPLRRLELAAMDLKHVWSPPAENSRKFVHIAIDDNTLKVLPKYPFPRYEHARVVRALDHLGAALIVFDVEFKHRRMVQERWEEGEIRYDPATGAPAEGPFNPETGNLHIDARELFFARAIRASSVL